MDIKKYTSAKIREYRKLNGLTQKELGDKIGVKHNTISGYENGTNEPEQDFNIKCYLMKQSELISEKRRYYAVYDTLASIKI